ncbi:hypothetical protein LH51_02330 [Nitrincola sp. A-D6]|uniref:ATP-dependent zinc protease family protein n=1 Tax=Nitrincola sp. A-D6 TaxID=1545442 RepID=UPI00051F9E6E|nr:ATP-dependent zinc protease [Nitrincola sp. A-D6]KGK43145.1 hypothetical protein LH51_02330 [Nitrincola sp. A-D6]
MLKWSIAIISSALLLGGCAPGHLYIEEGVVESIDQRLATQDDQINRLNDTQLQVIKQLAAAQETVISQLQSSIAEQVKPPECKPAPRLVCPQADNNGSLMLGGLEKQLIGEAERVHISPLDLVFNARIDTGATTSSLDARNIQRFERDGRRWVRFDTRDPETGEDISFERPVVRRVRISQSISDDYERRPVVELHFTLGSISHTAEFTLSDRDHLDFPLLIGRNVLRDQMVVDVSKQYIAPIDFLFQPD